MGPPMTEDRRNCDKKYAVAPFHRNMLEVRMSYWHSTSNFVCSAHLENALLWSCISVYRTLQTCVITALGENFLKPRSQRCVHTFVRAPWAPIKAMRTRTLHLLYVISRTWSKKDTTDESSDRQQRRFFSFLCPNLSIAEYPMRNVKQDCANYSLSSVTTLRMVRTFLVCDTHTHTDVRWR